MSWVTASLLAALLAWAGWSDVRSRRIPNQLTFAIGILWLAERLVVGGGLGALPAGGLILLLGFGAWTRGWIGAGDVKLLAALSLFAGLPHVLSLLLVVTLAGGALSLLILWHARGGWAILLPVRVALSQLPTMPAASAAGMVDKRGPAASRPSGSDDRSVPYGLAIAFGGLWLIWQLVHA